MRFVLGIWSKLEEFILVILFAFMAVMNFINVVFRYCFSQSFSFTEEITITAFVWVSMIGIAAAYKRLAHMGMSFFVDNMPKKIQGYLGIYDELDPLHDEIEAFYMDFMKTLQSFKLNM